MSARLLIRLTDGDTWLIDLSDERLEAIGGLPAGRVYRLERRVSDIQTRDVFIRPYYRRTTNDIITIFAIQTIPKEV